MNKLYYIFTLLFFICFISHHSTAQEGSTINAGFDFLFPVELESDSYQYIPGVGFFIEKPFLLQFNDRTSISPGLSFKTFREEYYSGGLGAGYTSDLKHNTVNGYLKWIYNMKVSNTNSYGWYIGILGGVHIVTWEKGTTSSYHRDLPEGNWTNPKHNESPSLLFGKLYPGVLTGIKFRKISFIIPSLELKFLSHFIKNNNQAINAVELSIKAGI